MGKALPRCLDLYTRFDHLLGVGLKREQKWSVLCHKYQNFLDQSQSTESTQGGVGADRDSNDGDDGDDGDDRDDRDDNEDEDEDNEDLPKFRPRFGATVESARLKKQQQVKRQEEQVPVTLCSRSSIYNLSYSEDYAKRCEELWDQFMELYPDFRGFLDYCADTEDHKALQLVVNMVSFPCFPTPCLL